MTRLAIIIASACAWFAVLNFAQNVIAGIVAVQYGLASHQERSR